MNESEKRIPLRDKKAKTHFHAGRRQDSNTAGLLAMQALKLSWVRQGL